MTHDDGGTTIHTATKAELLHYLGVALHAGFLQGSLILFAHVLLFMLRMGLDVRWGLPTLDYHAGRIEALLDELDEFMERHK